MQLLSINLECASAMTKLFIEVSKAPVHTKFSAFLWVKDLALIVGLIQYGGLFD